MLRALRSRLGSYTKEHFHRPKKIGLIDDRYVMSQPDAEVSRWNELAKEIRSQEARRMAAYAGMLERLVWNVGRLLRLSRRQRTK